MVDHLLHPITSVATLPFTPLKTNMTLENHQFSIGNTSSFRVDFPLSCHVALPQTNIAPENRPSQKETSIPTIHFQVRKC